MDADYIIVGSGSAGCALAYRLSQTGEYTVIIIEAGGSDSSPIIQMPAALSYPMNSKRYDWGYLTEPEENLNNRKLVVPRGKVLGGSSSINGMVYVRGHACDYDYWQESGATGWGSADVLPYFKRMESWHHSNWGGDGTWRGKNGPLHITRGKRENPLYDAFVNAGEEAGYELTDDYNGQKQEGFGVMEQTVFKGRRWSSSNAYLKPALKRKNVELFRGFVNKVVFRNKEAIGVEVSAKSGLKLLTARKEIILAASAINSPKILMHSGIGPGNHLQQLGIEVLVDRPGVGQNLQDHLEVYVQQECLIPITLYKYWNWMSKLAIGAKWLTTKKGFGATNHFESAAFVRSRSGIKYPDVQFHFLPFAVRYDGTAAKQGHGFQVHVGPMRSSSRGSVKLSANNFQSSPKIKFNYMSADQDWVDFRKCISIAREIFSQKAFDPYRGMEIQPGESVQSDIEIDKFIAEHAESAYHPCGTCKMGKIIDPMAVVDPNCRVIGVEKLRVADSSIFPQITNGNLNAPSIMVGEKASDHILGLNPLMPENLEPWISKNWRISDR
ncbi:MAG: choline dehydrogenase [Paracoccaceae bacterium]|nr:choline dehydrogenase [Paracoccaceae bacterium]